MRVCKVRATSITCLRYATDHNYRCNYGNRFVALSEIRRRTGRAIARLALSWHEIIIPDKRDTYLHRYRFISTFETLLYTQYSTESYKNTRIVATAAYNRVSVSDCSRTIVRSRQFLIITCVHLESAMMPLAL